MPDSTFDEFAEFIEQALNDFRVAQADTEGGPDKQMLTEWWTCFSVVVVPDLLLETEAERPRSRESSHCAEPAVSTPYGVV